MYQTKLGCLLYDMYDRIILFRTNKVPSIWTPSLRIHIPKFLDSTAMSTTMKETMRKLTALSLDPVKFHDTVHNYNRSVLFISKLNKTFRINSEHIIDIQPVSIEQLRAQVNRNALEFTYDTKEILACLER